MMNVHMVMVSTANGKITNGSDPNVYSWTSKEDQELFFSMIADARLIVMGRKTYEAARHKIKLSPDTLRVVITRNPGKYKSETVKGQLEFTDESPPRLVRRLHKKGYHNLLLAGGAQINALFLKQKLVNKLHLTIEPLLFGKGQLLIAELDLAVSLKLQKATQLNKNGTLHLVYEVI